MREETSSEVHCTRKNNRGGFTLAELLVVVAIIGILVAVSIPVFTSQIHKARVATDWANLRAYYSELQADFISTGKCRSELDWDGGAFDLRDEIDFLDGQNVKMKTGKYVITMSDKGYQITYWCGKYLDHESDWQTHYDNCSLTLGNHGL